jgi:single-stranded-DNA-specific exonuclease
VDLVVSLEEVTPDFERLCRYLEPCGTGNPGPVFGVRGARLLGHGRVGANHLKGVLDDGRGRLGAIGFQWADRVPWLAEASGRLDAAFRLEQNVFNGTTSLQARLVALSPCRDG